MRVYYIERNTTTVRYALSKANESPEKSFVRSFNRRFRKDYRIASYREVSSGRGFMILSTTAKDGFKSQFTLTWKQ